MRNILWAVALLIGSEAMAADLEARGSFTVTMVPEAEAKAEGLAHGRIAITKQFSGALVGQGAGTMLSGITPE